MESSSGSTSESESPAKRQRPEDEQQVASEDEQQVASEDEQQVAPAGPSGSAYPKGQCPHCHQDVPTLPAERPCNPGGLKPLSLARRFKHSNLVEPRMNHSNDFKPPYRLSVVVGKWFTDGS